MEYKFKCNEPVFVYKGEEYTIHTSKDAVVIPNNDDLVYVNVTNRLFSGSMFIPLAIILDTVSEIGCCHG